MTKLTGTLAEFVKACPEPLFPFDPLALHLTNALAWLHDVGQIVHGDIKPDNILLSWSPSPSPSNDTTLPNIITMPVLTDFTSSSALDAQGNNGTEVPLAGATYQYLAPEAFVSPARHQPPTRQQDTWAMGMTLLELLVGSQKLYAQHSTAQIIAISLEAKPLEFFGSHCRLPHKTAVVAPVLVRDVGERLSSSDWPAHVRSVLG